MVSNFNKRIKKNVNYINLMSKMCVPISKTNICTAYIRKSKRAKIKKIIIIMITMNIFMFYITQKLEEIHNDCSYLEHKKV